MNNNKKYKKWSLGLVAPALVLAPIAVVASCSSSSEEKAAYGVTFTNNNEIRATIHKAVQPTDLTKDQFKEEVLAHKNELFTIEGTLPSESFLNDNIEIGDLNPSADTKAVSAKVKLNKANTNGEAIEKTITLTGLGYEEVTLTDLKYIIAFKDDQSNHQEIELTGQENTSVGTLTEEKLIDLVLDNSNKDKILDITGDDAAKITDEVLANQILSATELSPAATEGKVTFTLNVAKPKDGAGDNLEKTITFTGFKQETDSTPESKNVIAFKAKTDGKYVLKTISEKPADEFEDIQTKIKPLIIQEKDVIFEATEGTLPTEQEWWNENLLVSEAEVDGPNGEITVTIQLNNANSTDSSAIKEENVILAGFQPKPAVPTTGEPTTAKTEVSTVTLGLNGSLAELIDGDNTQINENWVFENKRILFEKGTEPITLDGITSVRGERIGAENNQFNLKFTLAEGKYYGDDQNLGTTSKDFAIKIIGVSAGNTKGEKLRYKSGTDPLSIGLVDPELAKGTYQQFIDNAADIFNKDFVFKYRKHLLTGDFSAVDTAGKDGFLKDYDGNNGKFVKVNQNDTNKTIEIKFTILKDKLVTTPTPATDEEYSITFKEFKTT